MAITPLTGFKALEFDGETSTDYGVQILGEGVFNAPKREVQMISIPGRNGTFALDKGRFENIEVKYPANIIANNTTDFADAVSAFRNMLCSRKGYCRLTDDYHPDEYRMAVYKSGLTVTEDVLRAGKFDIVFDCKPQRWLTSGEDAVTIGEWGETETASGSIATFEGDEVTGIKNLVVDIEPVQSGSGTPSLDNVRLISGWDSVEVWDDPKYGGTVAWNQNCARIQRVRGTLSSTYNGTSDIVCTSDGSASTFGFFPRNESNSDYIYIKDHIYVVSVNISSISVNDFKRFGCETSMGSVSPYFTTVGRFESVCKPTSSSAKSILCVANSTTTTSDTFTFNSVQVFDLTAMFGSTIADYIYSLEQTTAGAGVAWFKNLFPKDYYAYNAGTSTCVSAVNGDPYEHYTTDLNDTRYVGTLDVVSGVLTVTHKMITVDGSTKLFEGKSGSADFDGYRVFASDGYVFGNNRWVTKTEGDTNGYICNQGEFLGGSSLDNGYKVYMGSGTGCNLYYSFSLSQGISTIDLANAYAQSHPIQFIYKLATPQTVQLTAQQVSALVGTNNVWANSGDVSVEYGEDPNILVNPTLFESSPLVVADGYGAISFNDYTINIEDIIVGDVPIASQQTVNNNNVSVEYDDKAATFSSGDQITLKNIVLRSSMTITTAAYYVQEAGQDDRPMGIIYWNSPNTDATLGYSCSGKVVSFSMTIPQITLTVGTNLKRTYTTRATVKVEIDTGGGTQWERQSWYATTVIDYKNGKIKITAERLFLDDGELNYAWPITQNSITIGAINGYSTTRIEVGTKYIDCELGEAYLLDGDTSVNLNQHIDLGSDLPKLASGSNNITYSNTITALKFVPRWWKV